jgi:CheY-like chemotaxis protein
MSDCKKTIENTEKEQKNWRDIFMKTPIPMAIIKGPNHFFCLANSSYLKLVRKEVFNPIKSLPLEGMKILYADDSLDNQFLIEYFLTKAGAKVSLASDGAEAVKGALETEYDVILMDIQMPKMDGYKVVKILMDLNVKAPIIALTALALSEEKEKTRLIGFDGHLTKPFNFNELLHEIVIRVSTKHNVFNS